MIFKTITGSVYEIDNENKQLRRVNGLEDPTPRVGLDGVWKPFVEVTTPVVGKPVTILWNSKTTKPLIGHLSPDVAQHTPLTMTSLVVEIQE
jgi:hypothetical protein